MGFIFTLLVLIFGSFIILGLDLAVIIVFICDGVGILINYKVCRRLIGILLRVITVHRLLNNIVKLLRQVIFFFILVFNLIIYFADSKVYVLVLMANLFRIHYPFFIFDVEYVEGSSAWVSDKTLRIGVSAAKHCGLHLLLWIDKFILDVLWQVPNLKELLIIELITILENQLVVSSCTVTFLEVLNFFIEYKCLIGVVSVYSSEHQVSPFIGLVSVYKWNDALLATC